MASLDAVRIPIAAALIALAVPGVASAQSTPVGGEVFGQMMLSLDQPAKGFAAFTKARNYDMTVTARATATDGPMVLSVAYGDVASGAKRGHLSVGSKRLAEPLQAAVGSSAFQPLDGSVDPIVKRWLDFGSNQPATIKLRQKVDKKATGTYHKLVLVTLSTEAP
jgi:hypothetical protein